MPTDALIQSYAGTLKNRFKAFEQGQSKNLRIEPIQLLSNVGSAEFLPNTGSIGSLPKIEKLYLGTGALANQLSKAGPYGAAAALAGLGLGTAYAYRNEINEALNNLVDLDDDARRALIERQEAQYYQARRDYVEKEKLHQMNMKKQKVIEEQQKYNKIKQDFKSSLLSHQPY